MRHCARSDTCGPYTNTPPLGSLKVNVRYATALPDKDGFLKKDSDPYVMVSAVTGTSRHTKNTKVVKNSNDPTWNQKLWIGCKRWKYIDVSVWDSDNGGDEELMPVMNFNVGTGKCSITHCNGDSRLYFDIELIPDGNECNPNPCYNGGTCSDLACGFRCSCPTGYYGTKCEYYRGGGTGCKRQVGITDVDGVPITDLDVVPIC